ncbi:FtsW/RodA/SpoVE family cell cycle protein [Blattabacterium cuenoti]|uniref:FtsW/RodA/SpoVE family cell cycle protein n=1 Tax=Blattabacterium cuenoti TaxID=1653831 RepID=UPI00163D1405|nr:FtsW/RodA/SpoVE family cell cycle protein [Blattabacterium cuenoti]
MKKIDINKYIKGDKHLWIFISLLSIFSFFSAYTISSSLVIFYERGFFSIFCFLFKHFFLLFTGFIILFTTQFINYKFFYKMSKFFLPVVLPVVLLILLFMTVIRGEKMIGINIFKFIYIPIIDKSFQIYNIASLFLFIYCARYLTDKKNDKIELINSFIPLLFPIFLVILLVSPYSRYNAIIIFISILIFLFIGRYPIINLIGMFLIGILFSVIYILFFIHCNEKYNIDVDENMWKNNIEKFSFEEENYKIIKSKFNNKIVKNSENDILKNFLPESYSDFIYPIIIEKYGFFGGIILLFIYLLILFRIIIIATKVQNYFCTLLVFAVGFPIIIQALFNMGLSVGILPFTGQNLPLISTECISIWITFFSFGIILSISRMIYEKSKLKF